MTGSLELRAAIAAARGARPAFPALTDDDLLADLDAIEELGRLADGLRLAVAREVEVRSAPRLGEERLSFRSGAKDGAELVRKVARIGHTEAKRRVGLGMALAPKLTLLGQEVPGKYAPLADAVESGLVGADSARVIISTWKSLRRRVDRDRLDGMVVQLTDAAMSNDTEQMKDLAGAWAEILDPDGSEPKHTDQRRRRALKIHDTLTDGTTSASLVLTTEHLALLRELLQSRRRGATLERTEPGSDDDEETSGGEWREEAPEDGDPRTRAQQDYDTLFETLEAGAKAEQADVATEVTHETVVTVTAAELLDQRGQGWAPGVLAGLPIPVVEQRMCSGGVRLLVTGTDGEICTSGDRDGSSARRSARRSWSPPADAARLFHQHGPGCRTPAPFLEAHHADWYQRDDGPTDVGNGIMLCSYHHHLMHATHSPVKVVRHEGDLWIVPQRWSGPPLPHHRRQSGPLRDTALDELRRLRDPDRSPFAVRRRR